MKFLLIVLTLGFFTAVLTQYVKVQEEVTGYLGQEVTLPCHFMNPSSDVQVAQVNWVKESGGKKQNVAVYHPKHGPDYPSEEGTDRIQFRTLSLADATLIIRRLRVSDEGTYICRFAAYPMGNEEGITNLVVLANQDQLDQTWKAVVQNLTKDLEVKMGILQRSEFSAGLLGLLHGAYARASRRIRKLEDELPTEISEGFDTVYGISTGVAEKSFKVLYEAWRKADIQKRLNDWYTSGSPGWGNLPAEPVLRKLIALSREANEKLNENLKHHLDKLRPHAQDVQNQVYKFQESVVQPVTNQAVEAFKLAAEKVNQITKSYMAPCVKAVRKHTKEFKEWVSAPVFPPEQ